MTNNKFNNIVKNMSLLAASIFLLIIFFEFIVFRFILPASDLPVLAVDQSNILRYQPNQSGVYRLQNEIKAEYRINQQGWNSGRISYDKDKSDEIFRVCIIGDSYIEALQVDFNDSVSEILEEKIITAGIEAEVFRFGLSGAPLSQYVFWLENEVSRYDPDLVIINLVHNDFSQSLSAPDGTYSQSFAILKRNDKGFLLNDPSPYKRDLSWFIKRSAIFRYLWVKEQIRPDTIKSLVARIGSFFNNKVDKKISMPINNVSQKSSDDDAIFKATDYLFQRLKKYSEENSSDLVLVMDGNRGAKTVEATRNKINDMVENISFNRDIFLLDLTPIFWKDYIENKKDHQFKVDGHWNSYAHGLVADSIFDFMKINKIILASDE